MLRSLYSAVSGMKAHQTKLDVIGNNIANVNTYGFKSSRARFQDVFYQTLQSAAGGDNNKGGTNASQVGYGSQLGGIVRRCSPQADPWTWRLQAKDFSRSWMQMEISSTREQET